MKVAKLPNGKVLKFPNETPDETIDHTVKKHLDSHIKKKQEEENKSQQSKHEELEKHNQIIDALAVIAQHLHNLSEITHRNHADGHKEIMGAIVGLTKAYEKPRKRVAIRDKAGKLLSVEDRVG